MQTQLPRRPFVEQLPPADGLAVVRRAAARRRRRRAAAVAAGGVTAVVVTVAALLIGGGVSGDAVLRPMPAQPASTPSHQAVPLPTQLAAPSGPHHAAPLSPPGDNGPLAPAPGGGQRSGNGGTRSDEPATPTLTRSRSSYTGWPRECSTATSSDNTGLHVGANWCVTATATQVRGGVLLSLQACRDSTGAGTLTFTRSREVDFVVSQGGKKVWSWSRHHPGASSQHTLSAPADGCWNWSLVWPGINDAGARLGHGTFTVTATSTADELYGAARTADFSD